MSVCVCVCLYLTLVESSKGNRLLESHFAIFLRARSIDFCKTFSISPPHRTTDATEDADEIGCGKFGWSNESEIMMFVSMLDVVCASSHLPHSDRSKSLLFIVTIECVNVAGIRHIVAAKR